MWDQSLGDKENKICLLSGKRRLHLYTISLSGIRSNGGYCCLTVLRYSQQYINKPPVLTRLGRGGWRSRKKRMMMKIWRNVRRWKGCNVQWRLDQLPVLLATAGLSLNTAMKSAVAPNCTIKQGQYPGRKIGTWFTDLHSLKLDTQYGYNSSMPQSRTIHFTNIYCSLDYHKYRSWYAISVTESVRKTEWKKDGAKALSVSFIVSLSNMRNVSAYPRLSRSPPQQKHPYRPRYRNIHPDSLYCTYESSFEEFLWRPVIKLHYEINIFSVWKIKIVTTKQRIH
jgi:hypothetical protein